MTLPILEIVADAIKTGTATEKLDTARAILSNLRDHDRDPDSLVVRLETTDAERHAVNARADSFASAHELALTDLARVADERDAAVALATTRAGAVRVLKAALDGQPFDVDAARAIVEGDPDATAEAEG